MEYLSYQLCYLVLPVILQWCITCILNSPYWQHIFRNKGITYQNKPDSNTPINFIKDRGAIYKQQCCWLTSSISRNWSRSSTHRSLGDFLRSSCNSALCIRRKKTTHIYYCMKYSNYLLHLQVLICFPSDNGWLGVKHQFTLPFRQNESVFSLNVQRGFKKQESFFNIFYIYSQHKCNSRTERPVIYRFTPTYNQKQMAWYWWYECRTIKWVWTYIYRKCIKRRM